jgi:glycosyltransferase involved in cell wall biosynthesis
MGSIRIEGDPVREISRELYDLARTQVAAPKAVCHAPFGALHVRSGGDARSPGASFAPCRHSRLPIGSPSYESIAEVFDGDAAKALRDRFRRYVVRREECGACVELWEDGAAAQSPSIAEFDRAVPPVNGVPPSLRSLSVQSTASLPEARVAEMHALLPQLTRLDLLCDEAEPGAVGRDLLERVQALPEKQRPEVRLLFRGAIPDAHALPDCVAAVELELPLTRDGLAPERRAELTGLVAHLAARGAKLAVRTEIGRSNWLELKGWLAAVLACGAAPSVAAVAKGDADSLAALDADLLSTLHFVLYRWSLELGIANDERRGTAAFDALLQRVRAWQDHAAERAGATPAAAGAEWSWPALDHPLLADESEARALLQDFLRVYAHPAVERWLARLTHHPGFVGGARRHGALRLIALWLGCVFDRGDLRPTLRKIYEDAATAANLVAADRAALKGTRFASWYDSWVGVLELEKPPRRAAPFVVPPVRKAGRARPQVTAIIPSYNHEHFVGQAIDSVLAQEGAEVRVLVVDDASTDGTVAAARTRKDPRVAVRANPRNVGLGESLQRALRTVTTPFVAVLNSDDLFHPRRLARCLAALDRQPRAAVVATSLRPIDATGRAITAADASPIFDGKRQVDWLRWFEGQCRDVRSKDPFARLLQGNYLITSSNLVCRRDWLVRHAGRWSDLDYCVDWQILLLAAQEQGLRVLNEPLLAYRLHASNTIWFDEERAWRFYVESHRVIARALEESLASQKGPPARRFERIVAAVAAAPAHDGVVDWAGVYLGLLLERLKLPSRKLRGTASRDFLLELEKLRALRYRAHDVAAAVGDHLAELERTRGELPWLRSTRNRFEVAMDDIGRLRARLESAVAEKRKTEALWRSAENDRDREAADKVQLYQRIGDAEAEIDLIRRETERRAEVEARELRQRGEAVEQARAALVLEQERARVQLDAERAAASDRLDAERRRLFGLMNEERVRGEKSLEREREAHARELAAEARRREEELARAAQLKTDVEASLRASQAEQKALRDLLNQRTRERDEMKRTPEFRVGHVLVNRMRLKRPLRAVENRLHKAKIVATTALLRAERRGLIRGSGGRTRVFATVCWNFPIYSQTFVYQELLQLTKRGFDLRLIYSMLEPRDHLNAQFEPLWKLKRTMHLDRTVHERDYMLYRQRFPDRVDEITRRLCAASGMSREALVAHVNFLQGFTYARLAEAWGADYLHSYFFYDRSLMSLIAGHVLNRPRGVSCYADHLLKDYELKVVPLHLETCDVVVATSNRIKRELLALAPDIAADKILVKPNAIDCNRFPVIPRPEPAPGQPFRLVVTSRIEPKKGLIHLVEAVKLLCDEGVNVECHLVGDADKGMPASENCKAELEERVQRLGLAHKVHLEGRQGEQGVRSFLAMAHLFVAPFVETEAGDKDGIPTALVEALATGIPSVVTDAGSILEVVDDGVDARVVRQRDPRGLADAIRALLADPALRLAMAQKAAQKARERFDVAVCEPLFHDRIRAVLAAARR